MALLKIAQMGHPVLRASTPELLPDAILTADVQRVIDDMVETMRDSNGVGIAAPQVHVPARAFAIEVRDATRYPDAEPFELLVVINPVVTPIGDAMRTGWEGCLSMFGLRGVVTRHKEVRLTGLRRDGSELAINLSGFAAVVAQHECDHLDGVLFVDRMQDMTSLCFEAEYQRFHLASRSAKDGGSGAYDVGADPHAVMPRSAEPQNS